MAEESKRLDEEIISLASHPRASQIFANQLENELLKFSDITAKITEISLLAKNNRPNLEDEVIIKDDKNSRILNDENDLNLNQLQAELNEIEEFLSSFNEKLAEKNQEMFGKRKSIEELSKQFEKDINSMKDVVEGCTQQLEGMKVFEINAKEELEEINNLEMEKQGIFHDLKEKVEALRETVKNLTQMN